MNIKKIFQDAGDFLRRFSGELALSLNPHRQYRFLEEAWYGDKNNPPKTALMLMSVMPLALVGIVGPLIGALSSTFFGAAAILAVTAPVLAARIIENRKYQQERLRNIEEINPAGQKVYGQKTHLCRLSKIQKKIGKLRKPFNDVAEMSASVQIKIDTAIASVENIRHKIHVLGAGEGGASVLIYEFAGVKDKLALARYRSDFYSVVTREDIKIDPPFRLKKK